MVGVVPSPAPPPRPRLRATRALEPPPAENCDWGLNLCSCLEAGPDHQEWLSSLLLQPVLLPMARGHSRRPGLSETSLVRDKSRITDAQAPGPRLAGPRILQIFAHLDFPFSRRQKAGHRLPSAGH
ncbi:unnamed protein product [Rangifer tarandus platyrhynchus]|uniref:Uncharacterized protein n=1 Tax=Rangifer tarandus platyrhynchus TaxID=3082113 RepID=A0AC59YA19_RANTA